jgi:hypothetical protein
LNAVAYQDLVGFWEMCLSTLHLSMCSWWMERKHNAIYTHELFFFHACREWQYHRNKRYHMRLVVCNVSRTCGVETKDMPIL